MAAQEVSAHGLTFELDNSDWQNDEDAEAWLEEAWQGLYDADPEKLQAAHAESLRRWAEDDVEPPEFLEDIANAAYAKVTADYVNRPESGHNTEIRAVAGDS